jgi:adenylate cyclase
LSEDAYRQVKGRLDLKVVDLGPTQLKNIAEPIRAYSLQVGVPVDSKRIEDVTHTAPTRQLLRSGLTPLAVAFVALLAVVAGGAWWLLTQNQPGSVATKPAEAARLSIVVMPFANLSGDPGQEYMATP